MQSGGQAWGKPKKGPVEGSRSQRKTGKYASSTVKEVKRKEDMLIFSENYYKKLGRNISGEEKKNARSSQ